MFDFSPALDILRNSNNIIITSHINPDGDAIGSSLAIYHFLRSFNKNVQIIINESKCPASFHFLLSADTIKQYIPKQHDALIVSSDCIIVVDCGDLNRLKNLAEPIRQSSAKKILIDHHVNPEQFTSFTYSDPNSIATGELVYAMLAQANAIITKDIAEALYVSIYTDSGGFRFPNTSSFTFQVAGELVRNGASPYYIYEHLYNSNSPNKLLLQGLVLSSLETYFNSQLTIISVTKEMFMATHTTGEHTEGFSQIPLSACGCKVGIMLSEYADSELRVSLRSKNDIDVRQIALKHGGGGHVNAAGCRLHNMTIEDAKTMLINEVKQVIKFC